MDVERSGGKPTKLAIVGGFVPQLLNTISQSFLLPLREPVAKCLAAHHWLPTSDLEWVVLSIRWWFHSRGKSMGSILPLLSLR